MGQSLPVARGIRSQQRFVGHPLELGDVVVGDNHQVAIGVGEGVQDDERTLAAEENQVLLVI